MCTVVVLENEVSDFTINGTAGTAKTVLTNLEWPADLMDWEWGWKNYRNEMTKNETLSVVILLAGHPPPDTPSILTEFGSCYLLTH
mgnify:CR=1 FL=1|jgi:hypothetical protein